MRILLLSLAAIALSACATASAPAPAAPAAPVVAQTMPEAASSSRVGQLLAAAGRPNAPTQADIEHVMGAADITRRDGAGVALTYRLDHCALLLVFGATAQNQMRLSDAHPSARQTGDAPPTLEQCAAEAASRQP